jgi:hypothetical protein
LKSSWSCLPEAPRRWKSWKPSLKKTTACTLLKPSTLANGPAQNAVSFRNQTTSFCSFSSQGGPARETHVKAASCLQYAPKPTLCLYVSSWLLRAHIGSSLGQITPVCRMASRCGMKAAMAKSSTTICPPSLDMFMPSPEVHPRHAACGSCKTDESASGKQFVCAGCKLIRYCS